MAYIIRHTADIAQMDEAPVAIQPWGGEVVPATFFRLGWTEEALHLFMRCAERAPRANVHVQNGNVCHDSCMECFLSVGDKGYFNFEMNAIGTLHAGFGTGRHNRRFPDLPAADYPLTARAGEDGWSVSLTVPLSLLKAWQPDFAPRSGLTLRGNCFKCEDDADRPYWACAFPIDPAKRPAPDFHQMDDLFPMTLA